MYYSIKLEKESKKSLDKFFHETLPQATVLDKYWYENSLFNGKYIEDLKLCNLYF